MKAHRYVKVHCKCGYEATVGVNIDGRQTWPGWVYCPSCNIVIANQPPSRGVRSWMGALPPRQATTKRAVHVSVYRDGETR